MAGMEYLEAPQEVKDDLAALLQGSEDRYSDLQLHFLLRLNHLLRLRRQQHGQLNAGGLRLLDRAIFSTYRDCARAGVSAEAEKVVQFVGSQSPGRRSSDN